MKRDPGAAAPNAQTSDAGRLDSAAVAGHLFRREAGRMAAALVRLFGLPNLDLAEDIVQDALCEALETWKFGWMPERPGAWLMQVAKHRALDAIRRQRTARRFAPELADRLNTEWSLVPTVENCFLDSEIADGELRLMFALCHHRLPAETQALAMLKYLCGFGVRELAQAFLSQEDAIEKKLARARATLGASGTLAELGNASQARERLPAVVQAIYLLFNEGYHGSHPESVVQEELCAEALRLADRLAGHPATAAPDVFALIALMCFLAARLPARRDAAGDLLPLEEQDRGRWDRPLIARGFAALERSASGEHLDPLHLEAAIAAKHAIAGSVAETDWAGIVEIYDRLLLLRPSPVIALNRAVAVGQAQGPEAGMGELDVLAGDERLGRYVFFHAARADLLRRAGRLAEAAADYRRAIELARGAAERRFFERRLGECAPRG